MRARASSLAISKQLADPGSQDTMNELFRTNVSVRVDVWMECLDGSVRWVEWTLWYAPVESAGEALRAIEST